MDRQLLSRITEQVVDMLRKRGITVDSSRVAAPRAQPPADGPTASPQQPRRVFITAELLEARLAAAGAGTLELADNEVLTPGAQDLVDQRSIVIRRIATIADAAPAGPPVEAPHRQAVRTLLARSQASGRATMGPVGLIIERPDENVRRLLTAVGFDGAPFVDCNDDPSWLANTDAMAARINAGDLAGGVLLMPYAANAMVVAAKIKGLRPVQGACPASVAAAVRHFDANVLVLEHRLSTFHEMRHMIRIFTAARAGPANRDVTAAIARHDGA